MGSKIKITFFICLCKKIQRPPAEIAQLVEQRTENPRVTGSTPVLGTYYQLYKVIHQFIFNILGKLDFVISIIIILQ